MNIQTSMVHLWEQGDGVHHAITVALLIASVTSWMVLLLKTWEHWQFVSVTRVLQRSQLGQPLASRVAGNPHYQNFLQALEQPGSNDLEPSERLERALDDLAHHVSWGMAWLGVVSSAAPFVGLLGTVWGIYHALLNMGAQHAARIDQVAGPIGEALIMTALGLAVALPATVGFNLLVRANKTKQFCALQLGRRWLQSAAHA